MRKSFTSLILLCFTPYASLANSLCTQEMGLPHIDPTLQKVMQEIGWHSASEEEVLEAPCKSHSLPSLEEMKIFIQDKRGNKNDDEEIQGINFKEESVTFLNAFRELVTPLHHLGFGLSLLSSKQSMNDKYEISSQCEDVICSVQRIWGEEMGIQVLYTYLKYGFNTSEYSYGHSSRYTADEMKDVILSLQDLPSHFEDLGWNKNHRGILKESLSSKTAERPKARRLSRFTIPNSSNSNQIADATISLMPLWSTFNSGKRQYTIYHELTHNMSYALDKIDTSKEWLKLSQWKKLSEDMVFDPNEKWESQDGCFVSGYAATKPQEDFAESVTAYRYAPHRFKDLCPEKYQFIKEKVYKNIDYLDPNSCEN